MPRCAGSSQCNCVVIDGPQTIVHGAGTSANPYRIEARRQGLLAIADSATIDLSLTGDGMNAAYLLSAEANLSLSQLSNVSGAAPTLGQVLGWDGTQWGPEPPATATPGLVSTSGCLDGDGSAGNPLLLDLAPSGGLACTADGLGLTAEYQSNLRTNHQFSYADSDETLPPDHIVFKTMPNGQHIYTAPDWAKSVLISWAVQSMYGYPDAHWAGSVGRCVVRRSSGDSIHPTFGDIASSTQGVPMMSQRYSGPRGSMVGYHEYRRLTDVVGGEEIRLFSQMRASSLSGNGGTAADASLTLLLSSMIWSDRAS